MKLILFNLPEVTPFAGVWIEIMPPSVLYLGLIVTPFAGVWIEMYRVKSVFNIIDVTPFAGVWIEILCRCQTEDGVHTSLPSRECGLKSVKTCAKVTNPCHSLRGSVDWNYHCHVAVVVTNSHSLRGSVDWNINPVRYWHESVVTPFAGVWIEIFLWLLCDKSPYVTPFAGVWIEIPVPLNITISVPRHSLRGSVDWNL